MSRFNCTLCTRYAILCATCPGIERKVITWDLRAIYAVATLEEAELALEQFAERWGEKYPATKGLNRVVRKWTRLIRDWKTALNRFVIMFGDRVSA